MEIPSPQKGQVTIYSKNNCIYCAKVKTFLKDNNILFNVIDCDDFILDNKEQFLTFIQKLIGKEYRMFPMVFEDIMKPLNILQAYNNKC